MRLYRKFAFLYSKKKKLPKKGRKIRAKNAKNTGKKVDF
jgi:hypothetical protein